MSPPDDPLLEGLNPVQAEAVTHTDGPLLIVAGAGSGKTRVLTHRIAHLIRDHGHQPVRDPRHHVHQQGRRRDEVPRRRARRPGRREDVGVHVPLGLRADPAARRRPARLPEAVHDLRPGRRQPPHRLRDPRPRRSTRSGSRRARCTPRSAPPRTTASPPTPYAEARAGVIYERKIADIFREYQARLQRAGAMDFDDLLGNTVDALPAPPRRARALPRRFKHVLVDEYQDTNTVQNELVLLLTKEHRNVCVVGDGDQCLPTGTMISTPDRARSRSRRSRSATR